MKTPEQKLRHMNAAMHAKWDELGPMVAKQSPQVRLFMRTIYQIAFTDGFDTASELAVEDALARLDEAEAKLVAS